ncbi:MAG: indole-3-glycerol phosphate synthase [Chloroflexi bacterium]|nr:MAG: indole-3-glycerol phosphate synthase [Chloroflexota bacterium]
MTRIKICGLRDPQHARIALDAGADMLGVVFAESPRQATVEQGRALRALIGPRIELFESNTAAFDTAMDRAERPLLVGVFARQSADEINRVAAAVDLDVIQLSGGEHPDLVGRLTRPAIRVHHVGADAEIEALRRRVRQQPAAVVALEAESAQGGGSGQRFDWDLAATIAQATPIMLGGGLRPDNVAEAITTVLPWAVDVSSGVEVEKGIKSPDLIRAFIRNAREALASNPPPAGQASNPPPAGQASNPPPAGQAMAGDRP